MKFCLWPQLTPGSFLMFSLFQPNEATWSPLISSASLSHTHVGIYITTLSVRTSLPTPKSYSSVELSLKVIFFSGKLSPNHSKLQQAPLPEAHTRTHMSLNMSPHSITFSTCGEIPNLCESPTNPL